MIYTDTFIPMRKLPEPMWMKDFDRSRNNWFDDYPFTRKMTTGEYFKQYEKMFRHREKLADLACCCDMEKCQKMFKENVNKRKDKIVGMFIVYFHQ